jgi:bifunctional DNase/RNase
MMRFVEEERLDGIDDMDGVIELHNCNGDIFALIRYTGETVQLTQSQRAFKVIIDHNGDKYALGLVFEDKDTGREFSAALTTFKKDWLTMHETQMEQMEDLKEHVDKLSIHSEDDDFGDFVAG